MDHDLAVRTAPDLPPRLRVGREQPRSEALVRVHLGRRHEVPDGHAVEQPLTFAPLGRERRQHRSPAGPEIGPLRVARGEHVAGSRTPVQPVERGVESRGFRVVIEEPVADRPPVLGVGRLMAMARVQVERMPGAS